MASTLTGRGAAVRARIIEATAREILAAGIGGTTLDGVRAATLTSKSQLFHYFPGGKAELVREVAAWEAEQLEAAQQPYLGDLGTWESWTEWRRSLEAYYFGLGRWACPIGSLASEASATDPQLAAQVAAILTRWREALARGVRAMQAGGGMRSDVDAERQAASVIAAIQGGLMLAQVERKSWPLDAAIDTAFAGLAAVARPADPAPTV